ncbi:MAG: lytic murein transglycosylase B [Burkholderiales bacterium]
MKCARMAAFELNPRRAFVLVLMLLSGLLATPASARQLSIDIQAFIHAMVYKHGFKREALTRIFSDVQPRPRVLERVKAPTTAKPWHEFRAITVTRERIDTGLKFWNIYKKALQRASADYGIPQDIIVATIGIESQYGHHMGGFRVIDALTTLAFQYPPRAEYFRGELEELMLLTRETGLDPLRIRGSYAGAIGIPQFMPSSYRKYAKDFDGGGKPDLVNSVPDAVVSIANYYRSFGWRSGEPVAVKAAVETSANRLDDQEIKPRVTVAELEKQGIRPLTPVAGNLLAAPFAVEGSNSKEYWLGLNNFYVITRYNRSINYALAVHVLAEELRAAKR